MSKPDVANDPWKGFNPFQSANRDGIAGQLYEIVNNIRDTEPVWRTPMGAWILSRYKDIDRLLKKAPAGVRTTSGLMLSVRPNPDPDHPREDFMLSNDPPKHTRLRALVQQVFTPRALRDMSDTIDRVVTECLDAADERGHMDVVADLALPVPSIVICEMMGVPSEDREMFTGWTADATHDLQVMPDPETAERATVASYALRDYFVDLVDKRRANLTDDILSGLIRAEQDGDRLSEKELISQAIGLLIAGFETTIGAIALGVRALLQNPDQLALLRERPELIKTAVEECLRYDTSIPITVRVLHDDCEFGDHTIAKDTPVVALIAAGQRDPEVFSDPNRFDITRKQAPVLAFGGGIHHCLGAHLARMEMQKAILALVQRFPAMAMQTDELTWGRSLFRVPARLDLSLR